MIYGLHGFFLNSFITVKGEIRMVKEEPRFQLGRFTGEMIELVEDANFEKIDFNKGDLVVVFHAEDFKKWYDGMLDVLNMVKCPRSKEL